MILFGGFGREGSREILDNFLNHDLNGNCISILDGSEFLNALNLD